MLPGTFFILLLQWCKSGQCTLCLRNGLASGAQTLVLHVQETQKEILEYAHDACHVFPGFEDQCEMYVNMYGPLVMGIIQQYLQPDAMCGRLGFCPLPPALN